MRLATHEGAPCLVLERGTEVVVAHLEVEAIYGRDNPVATKLRDAWEDITLGLRPENVAVFDVNEAAILLGSLRVCPVGDDLQLHMAQLMLDDLSQPELALAS